MNPNGRTPVHGMTRSPEYYSWQSMKARCYKRSDVAFARYGGAGITVCDEWRNSFEAFYAYMGSRPVGTTLDRYPNASGNYEPGNCRWATPTQQTRNRRDLVRVQTAEGVMDLVDYAKKIGMDVRVTHGRFKRGTLIGATRISS